MECLLNVHITKKKTTTLFCNFERLQEHTVMVFYISKMFLEHLFC